MAVDTETTGIVRSVDYAVVISISTGFNRYVVFEEAFSYFKDLLENPSIFLIMWNANFDCWMLYKAGIDVYRLAERNAYRVIDAMVMHALAGDQDRPHGLKAATKEMLGINMIDFKVTFAADLRRKRPLREIFVDKANEEVVANYAGLDAYSTLRMFFILYKLLIRMPAAENIGTLWDYFITTEVPFTRVLFTCELDGVAIDQDMIVSLAPQMERRINEIHGWFTRETGNILFNPRSGPQLADLFFNKLGLEPLSYTAGGQPQVSKKFLTKCAREDIQAAALLLEYRDLSKKLDTYIRGILRAVSGDGRLHTTFNQIGARTGRLSSCIARGTLIETVRDVSIFPKGVPIEDVKVGDLAYCYDDIGRLTLARVLASGMTGHRELVRVHWQGDGRQSSGYVDCTPDHLIRLVTGEYKRADSLVVGDRVLSLSRGVNDDGYARLWPTGQEEIAREHRFIFETVYAQNPEHVHHDDENKLNNKLANLLGMTAEEHTSLHSSGMSTMQRRAIAATMRKRWRDDYNYLYARCVKHGADNHTYLGLTKEWIESQLHSFAGKPTEVCTAHGIDYATFQKYMRMHNVDFRAIAAEYTKNGELLTADVVNRLVAETAGMPTRLVTKHVGMSFYRWAEVQRKFGHNPPNNHRIVRVERLTETADVFDLEIAGMHNFIANEICVHNSGPNLQNQPPFIRAAYVADEGYRLYARDFSQLEMCVLAHRTQDQNLLEAIREGKDLHCWCAALMFGIPYEDIKGAKDRDDEIDTAKKAGESFEPLSDYEKKCLGYRKSAKAINFGGVELPDTMLRSHLNPWRKECDSSNRRVKTVEMDFRICANA